MKSLVLLSGGVDSATCLAMKVAEYGRDQVMALNVFYGQRHAREIESARKVAAHYGVPLEEFNISRSLLKVNPRTALGYYEPGHYCFVVVDGRQPGYSQGASMETLARLMSSLGCAAAFNLDGGASSAMVFQDKLVNRPSGHREINDMLIIREPEGFQNEAP